MAACSFRLRLVSGLAPGELWRFVRAAQAAVEEAGGLFEGELTGGVALFDGTRAEWRLEGDRTFVVGVDTQSSCDSIEAIVRGRAAAWLERPEPQPIEPQVVVQPSVVAPKLWPWLVGLGILGAGVTVVWLARRRKTKR